jgi:hypothetical protein
MTTESEIQARILRAHGARPDVRLFRNTVGEGWQGEVVQRQGSTVLLRNARYVTFGLAPGSSDLIGWRRLQVGPGVVAQFLAIEVKAPGGRVADKQRHFSNVVRAAGGCAGIVRSPDEAAALLNTETQWHSVSG